MRHAGTLRLAAALAVLLACARPATAGAVDHSKEGICTSLDIRNSVSSLQTKLKGCRVIEGHLSIVLMERFTAKNFENISFPELREITGYLKIYRLQGLRNLGDLFPNLAVVRGLSLFKDFAIIIYDNGNLQALGLRSLEKVERGFVRIERNDRLCYINSIDWSRIVVDGVENNVIRKNYDPRLCGLCPNAEGDSSDRRASQLQCPSGGAQGRLLCWDERHCQKICPPECGDRSCTGNGTCCHGSCVGGCDGPSQHECHVCRYFSLGYGRNRTCVERCPRDTYERFKRCVSEQECLQMPAPVDSTTEGLSIARSPKVFNGTCIFTCPSGYMEASDSGHSTCAPCPPGGCVRKCNGNKIDAIASAEQFKGCTYIKGNLEISLRTSGGNTMAELEASLGSVREIEGSLRVIRSHPLVSLSFLKSLRRIGGQDSNGTKKQALYIFNNPNLELLWNWTKHGPIEISQGKLFIHFNPKLCYGLISPLKNMTKDPESTFDELEVSKENNGDQASCFQETLHLIVHKLHRQFVILKWNMYCLEDIRKLLGYSIYYIVAEHNITQYERRDACYDSWSVLDKTIDEVQNASLIPSEPESKKTLIEDTCNKLQPLFSPVTQLRPFTRYAAYVKTYTTVQDKRGAQSPIIYFKTLPGKPSPPQNLQADAKDAHTVQIRWAAPAEPGGVLRAYRVEVQANMYNHRNILQNNYCVSQVAFRNILSNLMGETLDKKKPLSNPAEDEACACRDPAAAAAAAAGRTRFTSEAEFEQAESIDFENALQNEVYHKAKGARPGSRGGRAGRGGRARRSHDNWLVITSNISDPVLGVSFSNETDADKYVKTVFIEVSHSQLNLTLSNLRHFTSYTVAVWACRARHENETRDEYNETWCSDRAKQNFLTAELESADVVSNLRATILQSNKTLSEVNVTWDPPSNPNGLVVAYTVQHLHVEDSSQTYSSSTCIAVEDFESRSLSYVLRKLAPGNYSIKVAPVSISGPSAVYMETFVNIPERKSSSGFEWVWGVIGGCLLMTLILGGGVWFARRNLLPSTEANKLFASVNPEYVSTVYVPDEWEVPRSSVELVKELGQGSFGMVYEGIAKDIIKGDPETRCAVKTVNEHATDRERIEFLNEASVMKAFDTFHVVRLLGVVSRGQPTLVVMELMALGDLKSYLRSHRPDAEQSRGAEPPVPPALQQIYQMAIEIADGMAYLSAKKFVHRDLAARNCMVAGDLTVKVGDFGMTRDIYETDYYRKGSKGLLPVRWMSPESLKDGVFSSNSDVWSYGVVLWEMATLAMQPYQGLSNEQVLRYVVEGGVMERPEHCPDRLYELMRACWAHRPGARPPFLRLVAELAPTAAPYFRHRSFFHTQQGQEIYSHLGIHIEEDPELTDLNVGAVATGSGSNLFGVSGRLASWVRELSSLRSRHSGDAAAEPLAPAPDPAPTPLVRKGSAPGPNGVLRDSTTRC